MNKLTQNLIKIIATIVAYFVTNYFDFSIFTTIFVMFFTFIMVEIEIEEYMLNKILNKK